MLKRLAQLAAPARLVVFVLMLLLVWGPLALFIYGVWGVQATTGTIALALLYGQFLLLVWWWARNLYRQRQPWHYYGLGWHWSNLWAFLAGLGLGIGALLGLLGLEAGLDWLRWQPSPDPLWRIVGEGLLVALAVALAEEILFRGWLLDELERDYAPTPALMGSSVIFAVLHFIRPLPEILRSWPRVFGLVLLGATLVWAKRCCAGQLGLAIGLHAGLVWGYYAIDVGQLVVYTGAVPPWVTGIHQNPLAGIMGFTCLGCIALGLQRLIPIVRRSS